MCWSRLRRVFLDTRTPAQLAEERRVCDMFGTATVEEAKHSIAVSTTVVVLIGLLVIGILQGAFGF